LQNRDQLQIKKSKIKSQKRYSPFDFLILIFDFKIVPEKLRLDKYLWAIRLFKTRTLASVACDTGKVKFNGSQAKAAKPVSIGDEYEVKTEAKRWRIKVTALLHARVKFEEAIKYYLDITPADEVQRLQYQAASFHTGKRKSKIGRPTKKERRDLDDFTNTK
jgi:ribosome-associated heat shock protein Hsp15